MTCCGSGEAVGGVPFRREAWLADARVQALPALKRLNDTQPAEGNGTQGSARGALCRT